MHSHSFKWYISMSLLYLCAVCGHPDSFAQQGIFSAENQAGEPQMVISETKFDFGDADEGSTISHDFIIKNKGRADLQITKVSPD